MEENLENLSLVYINLIGENNSGDYEYELFYSETPDIVWGEDWAEQCPAAVGYMPPDEKVITSIKRIISPYKMHCAQENLCFSMQDCIDGICKLAYIETDKGEFILKLEFAENYFDAKNKMGKIGIKYVN